MQYLLNTQGKYLYSIGGQMYYYDDTTAAIQLVSLNGLSAYWKLDELSGTVIDQTGNNNGTASGTIPNKPGIINTGYNFDGTLDYILCGSHPSLVMNTSDFTISAWFKTTATLEISDDLYTILCTTSNGGNNAGYQMTLRGDAPWTGLLLRVGTGAGFNDVLASSDLRSTVNDGNWHNWVIVLNRASLAKFYLDNVEVGSTNISAWEGTDITNSANENKIGMAFDSSQFSFNGTLDEIGVWKRALSVAEVSALYSNGTGLTYPFTSNQIVNQLVSLNSLMAYYKFDGSLGKAVDLFNSYDGSLFEVNQNQTGKIGTGFYLPGTISHVDISVGNIFNFGDASDFSISIWMKTASTNEQYLVSKYGTGVATGFMIETENTSTYTVIRDGVGIGDLEYTLLFQSGGNIVTDDNWHYLVSTFDRDGCLCLYVDGFKAGEASIYGVSGTINNTRALVIGGRDYPISPTRFRGSIDEVGIWGRVLTAAEVSILYNNGSGLSYPFTT
jgi:hypothetical protein